jgi:hypothetical protein
MIPDEEGGVPGKDLRHVKVKALSGPWIDVAVAITFQTGTDAI